jgi:hypothetical protein
MWYRENYEKGNSVETDSVISCAGNRAPKCEIGNQVLGDTSKALLLLLLLGCSSGIHCNSI